MLFVRGEVAELGVLEDVLKDQWWGSNFREHVIVVVELKEKDIEENTFELVPKATYGDCQVESLPKGERRHSAGKRHLRD